MIVFVNSVKEEDDRNSFARVVVVIAAEEEPVRILRIVVFVSKVIFRIRLVDAVHELAEFGAHHRRANQINSIRSGELRVARVCVAFFLASPDHVDVDLRDDLIEWHGGIFSEVTRAPQSFLLTAMPDKQHRALRTRRRFGQCFSHCEQRGRARTVVIRAVANRVGTSRRTAAANVIVVCAERYIFSLQSRIAAFPNSDDILRRNDLEYCLRYS